MKRNVYLSLIPAILILTGCSSNQTSPAKENTTSTRESINGLSGALPEVEGEERITFLGDSITEGLMYPLNKNTYAKRISYDLNVPVQNLGFSGSTVSINDDFEKDNSYYLNKNFVTRAKSISSKSDIIFVLGGTNDFGTSELQSCPLGEKDSHDEHDFYGALRSVSDTIKEINPNAKVFFSTLLQRDYSYPVGEDTTAKNHYGYTMENYNTAIKEIAKEYDFQLVDLWNNMEEFSTVQGRKDYTVDGLHPNEYGHQKIADYFESLFQPLLNQ